MKIVSVVARYLLGLLFTIFGLNRFFHFIPLPPPVSPLALQYMTVLATSGYFVLVYLIQFVAGVLLLVNRYVPLALVLLAPVLVNVLLFHSLMDRGGIGVGLFATILWVLIFASVRSSFDGLFQAQVARSEA